MPDSGDAISAIAARPPWRQRVERFVHGGLRKLADFVVLQESPLDVPVDRVKDIGVVATVLGGKVFPVDYKKAH